MYRRPCLKTTTESKEDIWEVQPMIWLKKKKSYGGGNLTQGEIAQGVITLAFLSILLLDLHWAAYVKENRKLPMLQLSPKDCRECAYSSTLWLFDLRT